MAPVGNPSLFYRFFGLVENYPLYAMLGVACGLAAYMPFRHLLTDPELMVLPATRNHSDNLASSPQYLEKAKHYERGVLGAVSRVRDYPHVLPDVGVGSRPEYIVNKWTKPTTVPQPE